LIVYAKTIQIPKLIGYVFDANVASAKILMKCNFEIVEKGIEPVSQLPETKYELNL